jgi:hypothetical protein
VATLAEKCHDLPSMIRGVIQHVLHHFTQRQLPLLTLKALELDARGSAVVREAVY